MIRVGKKWDKGVVYVGRPSPLGNPYPMRSERDRDRVCDLYKHWFNDKVARNDPGVMRELERLQMLHAHGDLVLGCFCAPKRCHADTIKAWLEKNQ